MSKESKSSKKGPKQTIPERIMNGTDCQFERFSPSWGDTSWNVDRSALFPPVPLPVPRQVQVFSIASGEDAKGHRSRPLSAMSSEPYLRSTLSREASEDRDGRPAQPDGDVLRKNVTRKTAPLSSPSTHAERTSTTSRRVPTSLPSTPLPPPSPVLPPPRSLSVPHHHALPHHPPHLREGKNTQSRLRNDLLKQPSSRIESESISSVKNEGGDEGGVTPGSVSTSPSHPRPDLFPIHSASIVRSSQPHAPTSTYVRAVPEHTHEVSPSLRPSSGGLDARARTHSPSPHLPQSVTRADVEECFERVADLCMEHIASSTRPDVQHSGGGSSQSSSPKTRPCCRP